MASVGVYIRKLDSNKNSTGRSRTIQRSLCEPHALDYWDRVSDIFTGVTA